MNTLTIIEFDPQYTGKAKDLLTRVLQSLDLPEVSEVQRPVPGVTYDDSDLDRIAEVYAGRSRFWLAVMDDEVIGMAAIEEVSTTVARLRRLFVAPAYHGTGAGKLLLDEALEFAGMQGFQTVDLDTHVGMHRAHAFYEKCGFRKTAEDECQRHYRLHLA